jgi:hypothetical protein
VLICDPTRSFTFAQYLPNNKVNSLEVSLWGSAALPHHILWPREVKVLGACALDVIVMLLVMMFWCWCKVMFS